jgi:hypothetical protein
MKWTTGLKWETSDTTGLKWAKGNYRQPTWSWARYLYPSGRSKSDYPAFKYCEDKWSWWRLPTKTELKSIITKTAGTKNSSGFYSDLPSITYISYWSATDYADTTNYAWFGNFYNGYMYYYNKYDTDFHTICIHD